MIHSCAGGVYKESNYEDYAKVQIVDEGEVKGKIIWYKSNISDLQVGDIVLVPYGKNNHQFFAMVLKVDKNVNEQVAPIPSKIAKYIIEKIDK